MLSTLFRGCKPKIILVHSFAVSQTRIEHQQPNSFFHGNLTKIITLSSND